MTTPAERIIKRFGGHAKISALLGVHVTRVYRWTYPTGKRGGSGGSIPQQYHSKLVALAKANGWRLTYADFHPREARRQSAQPQQAAE
jgi:hypothetical protein